MFGLRIIAKISTDKYSEFIKSIGSHSPQSPLNFFHIYADPIDESHLNIITESNSLKPLTDYIQTKSFREVVDLIKKLGSLEGIKMEKYPDNA